MFTRGTLAVMAMFSTLTMACAEEFHDYFQAKNTDYASFGRGGLRDSGAGNIAVSGIFGTINHAFLVWNQISTSNDPNAGRDVTFDGVNVRGKFMGAASSNCWGSQRVSYTYVADVTAIMKSGPVNVAHALTNFGGADPVNANGASLVLLYDDGNSFNNRDVRFYVGNDSNVNSDTTINEWDTTLGGIVYTSGPAYLELHVSDGQKFGAADDEYVDVNGSALDHSQSVFNGDSVPGPNVFLGNLWDVKTFNVTSFLSPGPNSLRLTTSTPPGQYDCWALCAASFLQDPVPACPGIQLDNLICGPEIAPDPGDGGKIKRVFRPEVLNIDSFTLRDVLLYNGIRVTDRHRIQTVRVKKITPFLKCEAFKTGPGSGLNTNFDTGLKFATNANLDDPVCNIAFGLGPDADCLGNRCLLFSPPCTTYDLQVQFVVLDANGFPGPPQYVHMTWTVAVPTKETIRCNIEYFSTVAAGVTQKCKITSDVVKALLVCLDKENDLEALLCFETVIGNASIDFPDLLAQINGKYDVRFKGNYLLDSTEEPIGCLLDEQALALLWHP